VRGRIPQPSTLKILRGNVGNRPILPEPQPQRLDGVPEPPPHLQGFAAEEWRRLAPEMHFLGLLTVLDLTIFEVYCMSYGHWRAAEELLATMRAEEPETSGLVVDGQGGRQVQNPVLAIARQAAADVLQFGREFGMTPSSRSRIHLTEAAAPSKFGGLLA
jgi:P27 family predicted phage terminase small subunit